LLTGVVLMVTGCQSTPGFQCGISFMVPPTINATSPLHPMPTTPQTSYAVEVNGQTPVVQRYYAVTPAPGPITTAPTMPPPVPRLQREMIPNMPTEQQCNPCK
jgi:hypothetical protein